MLSSNAIKFKQLVKCIIAVVPQTGACSSPTIAHNYPIIYCRRSPTKQDMTLIAKRI